MTFFSVYSILSGETFSGLIKSDSCGGLIVRYGNFVCLLLLLTNFFYSIDSKFKNNI